MNTGQENLARPAPMRPLSEEEVEAQAIRELERLERARNAKRSDYKPRSRRNHADRH